MTIFDVISLLGGLSLFLYGMRIMGEGLRRQSGDTLKRVLARVTNNPFLGFLLGLIFTCLIQSSTATVVLTVGLVGAGMLTFEQTVGIVFGANVGTTITGQIIRLLDINDSGSTFLTFLKPSTLAPLAALLGIILLMFIKKKETDTAGTIAMGFGILFTGLLTMSAAVVPLSSSESFSNIIFTFSKTPVLGFIAGLGITGVIQSSSAVVGMLQALSTSGVLTFASIYAVIIGINIGDCLTTALVCRLGAKREAFRVCIVHILFNVFGSIRIVIGLLVGISFGWLDGLMGKIMTSGMIANTHTVFKLSTAAILLPFAGVFKRMAYRLLKDKDTADTRENLTVFNENLFQSPALALESAHKAIIRMYELARDNIISALSLFDNFDQSVIDDINANEEKIDHLADGVDNYLIKLSSYVGKADEHNDTLNFYLQCFSEFERIGDFAVNLTENATTLQEKQLIFSDQAKSELRVLGGAIKEIIDLAKNCFEDVDCDAARRVEPLEEVVDSLVDILKSRHIERLRSGQCSIYTGLVFIDLLTNLERVSDHCSNLAVYTLAKGSQIKLENNHDYIKELHTGQDSFYTSEFDRYSDKYIDALKDI